MRAAFAIPFVIILALIQVCWAPHWAIGGIVPNVLLVALMLITILWGLRSGLIWAFVGGIIWVLLMPLPFWGELVALLVTVALVGFLAETVFNTTTVVTLIVQIAVGTVAFSVTVFLMAQLGVVLFGSLTDLALGPELIHALGQIIYHIGIGLLLYFLLGRVQTWLAHPKVRVSNTANPFY